MKRFDFLICSERSGSNFLTSLLNGHSAISGPPPSHMFRLFATNRANYGDLAVDTNWNVLVEDVVEGFQSKLGIWNTEITVGELKEKSEARSVGALLRVVYEKEAEHDGSSHVFVKENHTYRFAAFLLAEFPDCRFVLQVRDPRDVASSWVRTESIPGGTEEAVEAWKADQSASYELYQQLRDSGRILVVRYEDLVDDPVATLKRLMKFLGLVYEPAMLEFHQQERTAANARRIEAWANLGRPVMRANRGKYKTQLSETDQRFVELTCYDLMTRYGYECELAEKPSNPEALAREIETLRRSLDPGTYVVSNEAEQEIRRRRLAVIQRVLARRL